MTFAPRNAGFNCLCFLRMHLDSSKKPNFHSGDVCLIIYKCDLNKLTEWSMKWQMLFNYGKCKCLHAGHGNEDVQYTMGGTVLNTTLIKGIGLTRGRFYY